MLLARLEARDREPDASGTVEDDAVVGVGVDMTITETV